LVATALVATALGLHLVAAVLLRFFPSVEMLPLSAFPMFGAPHNVFDGAHRKWLWLTGKEHATGTLKNYCFPFCRKQTILAEELHRLNFPCVLYGHGGGQTSVMHANVEVGAALAAALAKINELDSQQRETYATDATAAVQLLDALDAAKAAFAKTPRAAAPRGNTIPTDFVPAGSDPLPVINATSLAPVDLAADFVPVDPDPLPLIDATASTFDAGSKHLY
jgi:hypothetical protein